MFIYGRTETDWLCFSQTDYSYSNSPIFPLGEKCNYPYLFLFFLIAKMLATPIPRGVGGYFDGYAKGGSCKVETSGRERGIWRENAGVLEDVRFYVGPNHVRHIVGGQKKQ